MLHNDTYKIQRNLAAYCRGRQSGLIPGINEERLPHYKRLISGVIYDTLETAYPITEQILTENEWQFLVDDFFKNHNIQTAQVWKMPFEFYLYCRDQDMAGKLKRPYLNDLLYFEWVEIEIHTMPDKALPAYDSPTDFFDEILVFNPDYKILELEYPVHRLQVSQLAENKGKYFIVAFREHKNFSVQFLEITATFAAIFNRISAKERSGENILAEISSYFENEEKQEVIRMGHAFINALYEQGLILGSKRSVIP